MSVKPTLYDEREYVLAAIDRHGHLHLSKNKYGNIDWSAPETVDKIQKLLAQEVTYGEMVAKFAGDLLERIDWDLSRQ